MKPHLPIGESDFRRIIQDGNYYVDKTLLISEIIDSSRVVLITRPRRFGKTLNMTTLRYFYGNEADNRPLFDGLKIMEQGERYLSKMGRHPVLFMSFKDIKNNNWKDAYTNLISQIRLGTGFFEKDYPGVREKLLSQEQEVLDRLFIGKTLTTDANLLLRAFCKAVHTHHGASPVLLIDEYDTPITASYVDGYYDECIAFMRDLLAGGLKDNPWLEKAVLTGIVRVAKESIFSGLNNLAVWSVTGGGGTDKFGFTEEEVLRLLQACGLNGGEMDNVRRWYNGYLFSGVEVYNPWSVLNYAQYTQDGFRPYWVNTSDNRLLRSLLIEGEASVREDLDKLMAGEWLTKPLSEHLVFQELNTKKEAVWNMLLASGYLKCKGIRHDPAAHRYHAELAIPNMELMYVYASSIDSWLSERIRGERFDEMMGYLIRGQLDGFEELLLQFLEQVASYHDTAGPKSENFYHALFLGMLVRLAGRYKIRSNWESGRGRYDIALFPLNRTVDNGVVIEIKSPSRVAKETLEQALEAAVKQLKEKNYAADLYADGVTQVVQVALAVQGKEFLVKQVK